MTDSNEPTILCIASFFKGNDFIRECKRQGARVVLLTREKLLGADWARESLDDLIAIPGKTSVQSYLVAASHAARQRRVSRDVGILQPEFVPLLNYGEIEEFMERTPAPWMLKPRIGASAMGIKKLHQPE